MDSMYNDKVVKKVLAMASRNGNSPALSEEYGENEEHAQKASQAGGIRIRRVRSKDASHMAEGCYKSFLALNQSVSIPPYLDFPSFEKTFEMMKSNISSAAETYGVVAEEESSGTIMGGGFLQIGEICRIGPIFTDNAFKGRGAAKAVMISLIEKAKSENTKSIRLCQIAPNVISFGLYAKLGFVPVECWMDIEGCVTKEQSLTASNSVALHSLTGAHIRRMRHADETTCNKLHLRANGFERKHDIGMAIYNGVSWVVVQDKEIIAYTTGFNIDGHAVAETEEAMVFLFTEVCLQHPTQLDFKICTCQAALSSSSPMGPFTQLKVRRSCWLMVIGTYQLPQHSMVYFPSILG